MGRLVTINEIKHTMVVNEKGSGFVAQYTETYLLNSSDNQTVADNSITVVPSLPLTNFNGVLLTITGVVYTGTTANPTPVNGANVVVYGPDGTLLAEDISKTVGTQVGTYNLVFQGEKDVMYRVVASLEGYNSFSDVAIFTNTETVSLLLLLTDKADVLSIYGRVVDAKTGAGIENANISVVGGGNSVTAVTGADGSFIVYDGFTAGTNYTVTASKQGYNTQIQEVTIPTTSVGRAITFTLDSDNTNITTITGRVIVEGSNPPVGIADAFVGLFVVSSSGVTLVDSRLSDSFGTYTFTNVDATQTYVIKANKIVQVNS